MTIATEQGLRPLRRLLGNGAVVLAKESRTSPAVTVTAFVEAGSIYDPALLPGVAHFVSRVIDRGTSTRDAEQLAVEFDNRGVSLAAGVGHHTMSLSCTCLAEDFEAVLALVGDIVMRPTFPADQVQTRRGEIVTAIRQDQDNPAVMASEGVFSLLYPNDHPFGRPIKGNIASVERISGSELCLFHRERFVPDAMCLVIVGDVDADRSLAEATAVFGGWESRRAERARLPAPPPARSRRLLTLPMMSKAQADIAYGFTSISRLDPSFYAFWLMNTILGQYALGGRLGDSIRERQGMAYYAFSAYEDSFIEGPLVIRAGVNPANVERAIASIDEEVSRMGRDGVTARELEEAKSYLIGSLPRSLETNADIASFLQTVEQFGLGLDYDVRLPALVQAVTLDEVNAMARAYLAPDRAAVVVAGPYDPSIR